jgi:hypothetical protein
MDAVLYGIAKMRHRSLMNEHANWKQAVATTARAKKTDLTSDPAGAARARAAAAAAALDAGSCRAVGISAT